MALEDSSVVFLLLVRSCKGHQLQGCIESEKALGKLRPETMSTQNVILSSDSVLTAPTWMQSCDENIFCFRTVLPQATRKFSSLQLSQLPSSIVNKCSKGQRLRCPQCAMASQETPARSTDHFLFPFLSYFSKNSHPDTKASMWYLCCSRASTVAHRLTGSQTCKCVFVCSC